MAKRGEDICPEHHQKADGHPTYKRALAGRQKSERLNAFISYIFVFIPEDKHSCFATGITFFSLLLIFIQSLKVPIKFVYFWFSYNRRRDRACFEFKFFKVFAIEMLKK